MHPSVIVNQKVCEDPFIYIIILMSTFPVTTETQPMTMLCIKKEIYDTINDDSSHDLILDFCHKIWPLLDLTALLAHLILRLLIAWLHLLSQSALIWIYKDWSFPNASVLGVFCLLNRMLHFYQPRKTVSLMSLMLIINYPVFHIWNIISLEYFLYKPLFFCLPG